ncbi:hypothetical protein PM082_023171 [Marasmius tenuissimus]|nr:hypothetical protein PM082_023171 [Marasmius tenuissimus]
MFIDVFPSFLRFLVFTLYACLTNAQVTSQQNFSPASFPLAVRSPHLNAWIAAGNGSKSLAGMSMRHWDNGSAMGWEGLIRVDGTTYRWLGNSGHTHGNETSLLSSEVTPTRSKFTILAGTVQLHITFLSPIEPDNWVLQSLPFVYLAIDVGSTDGQPHNVQLYSHVTGEWISGDPTSTMIWNTTTSDSTMYHYARRALPAPMIEIKNVAQDATLYFGTSSGSSLTWQTGGDRDTRGGFMIGGTLNNTRDTKSRQIERFVHAPLIKVEASLTPCTVVLSNWPVLAYAFDLGNITNTTSPTVLSLGLVRDPVVVYSTLLNKMERSPYFRTRFDDVDEAAKFFIEDYENAAKRADELDQRIMNDTLAISGNYRDLVTLGARQAIAGIEITVSRRTDTAWNMSDVKAFMKDTGISQRISPVVRIFSALLIFLYLNASLGGLLLDPLLDSQALSGGSDFAAPDLGVYPIANSNSSSANMEIESTRDMLITALAHAQRSGDGTLILRYYDLMKRWTEYLISNALHPMDQVSRIVYDRSDLAVKCIIGIAAMAKISEALNRNDDSKNYAAKAAELSSQWANLAMKDGHITSVYGKTGTKPLVYNLYADVLLQTNVYTSQTNFYDSLIPDAPRFGLPSGDTLFPEAHAPWTIFTAATVTQNSTRDDLIDMVHTMAGSNEIKGNFPVRYPTGTGEELRIHGEASPAQGAMFALLAQSVPIQRVASSRSRSSTATPDAGFVAGVVIGPLVGIGLLVVGALYWRKKRAETGKAGSLKPDPFYPTDKMDHQAPPLPRKDGLARIDGTLSTEDTARHNANSNPLPTSPSVGASSDASQLRFEVENLRREMEEMRSRTMYEPPPHYT